MKKEDISEPEDLGIKIGTEEEKFWTDLKEQTIAQNKTAERTLEMNKVLEEFCDLKIAEEQEKMKND